MRTLATPVASAYSRPLAAGKSFLSGELAPIGTYPTDADTTTMEG